ncbi:hypothetical protein [Desulfolithobacter sp.]
MTTTVKEKLRVSARLYQRLGETMGLIESKLETLDLETTIQAVDDLEQLHAKIRIADKDLLASAQNLSTENSDSLAALFKEHRKTLTVLTEKNKKLLPKLITRLTGYRTELVKIQNGITTMQGYNTKGEDLRGRHIDTTN